MDNDEKYMLSNDVDEPCVLEFCWLLWHLNRMLYVRLQFYILSFPKLSEKY